MAGLFASKGQLQRAREILENELAAARGFRQKIELAQSVLDILDDEKWAFEIALKSLDEDLTKA